ncbi:SDR family NAD(P)-dependent oxidoreductase [Saccharophagus sp. K07]|uniref:SDR family oxidoreductase n=1 Tax=Saccharophagus sp. K07 TaxID=2283636 RepID=UPI0016529219|nr:SDR family oxidoreductase [Saccharophagus sp. K07]MBC6905425.1 SDR family NAD(P)-dependent oxidoreductase [Saccharophagus sp. K07]
MRTIFHDPRTKYPTSLFPKQEQEMPGFEKKMQPLADHGEATYKGSGKLAGASALITGGDSGIGRAVALAYAREGANVAITYLDEEDDAQETKRLIKECGQDALTIRMDQTDRQACEKAVDACIEKFGRLDILVNNAAFQKTYDSLESIPDEDLDYTFRTNIEAFFYFSRYALKFIAPGGSIINTTSIQAYSPSSALAPYAATKAAIANFTVSLAEEAIKRGVRVNAVAPGPVWTPLIPSTMPQEKVRNFGENTLFERPAQPAELAPLYVFLASDEASYITGEIYGATGGRKQV